MEQEYVIIYGRTDSDPSPFIVAVSKDQNMINGFREEHYQFCAGGEVVVDGFYDNLADDYEIEYKGGHYMTPLMTTKFMEYLTSVYIPATVNNLEYGINAFDNCETVKVFKINK